MGLANGRLTAPLEIGEIYQCLGEGKLNGLWYDTNHICASQKINRRSLIKPIIVNTPVELTDAQFKAADYGYTIPIYSSFSGAISAYNAGTRWGYNKPAVGDWARLTDFIGYDHYAQDPVSFSANDTLVEENARMSLNFDIGGMLEWGSFSSMAPTYENLQFGFVVGSSWYPLTGDGTTILDLTDHTSVPLPPSASAGSSFTIYPMLTTYKGTQQAWQSPGSAAGSWWLLDCNPVSISVKQQTTPGNLVSVFGVLANAYYYPEQDKMSVSNLVVGVSNDNDFAIRITVTASISTPFDGTKNFGSSLETVPAHSQIDNISLSGSAYYTPNDPSYASIDLTGTFTSGTSYTVHGAYNVEPEEVSS